MKPYTKHIIFTVSFFLTFSCIFEALSDDDNHKKRYRYRGGRQKADDDRNGHDNNDHLKPVTNQSYKKPVESVISHISQSFYRLLLG